MKRVLDVVLSALGLLLLSPLLFAIFVAIRLSLGAPALFRQTRPGLGGRPFQLLKFRTMSSARDNAGQLLPDAQRLSPLGRFLRQTSLDELPELWNVLRGDMSLVGPRPLLMQYLPLYSDAQARRHLVRPGLTGWAQVNGRNALTWDQKFALDTWYVDNQSIALDLRILVMTVRSVLGRHGISHGAEATMPAFTGSAKDVNVPTSEQQGRR